MPELLPTLEEQLRARPERSDITNGGGPVLRQAMARTGAGSRPSGSHVVVLLPSYSVNASLMSRYADKLLELEHRHLLHILMLLRQPAARMVFVTSRRPSRPVLDYYLSLMPRDRRRDVRSRLRFLQVPDPRPWSVTAKLLDRPDLVERLRRMVAGQRGYVEPWNVTHAESRLADLIGLPVNGTHPRLWSLGFKSSGRRIMRAAGVPLPLGVEDVRSAAEVVSAVERIRRSLPQASGVMVKTDDSGAGTGNRLLRFAELPTSRAVMTAVRSWEPWYLDDLSRGAVVEEYVAGVETAFPSVQMNIAPGGSVDVVSTHEQLLGGPTGQVYVGCRFPAEPGYRAELSRHGTAVARVLAERGARGRLSVDFAAAREAGHRWRLYGLEINLRKTGTTHPFVALSNLVPGRYDAADGQWIGDDSSNRWYRSTDNLADPGWLGRSTRNVVSTMRSAGLEFDRRSGTGIVMHMLCGLDLAGRIGLTAIGTSPSEAEQLYLAAVAELSVPAVPGVLASSRPLRGRTGLPTAAGAPSRSAAPDLFPRRSG